MLGRDRHDEARIARFWRLDANVALAIGSIAGVAAGETDGHYAASRHSYRRCTPPMRGSETTVALRDGGDVASRPPGVSFPRPRCVRSS